MTSLVRRVPLSFARARSMSISKGRGPFTPLALEAIRGALAPIPPPSFQYPPHTVSFASERVASEAAVLIPLMNIGEEPHVLMEVRASGMRVHAGEISFPGGKIDPTDGNFVDAALREAREELQLPSDNVEILGMLPCPEYSLGNKSRVWPVIGFVHASPRTSRQHASPRPTRQGDPNRHLPSLPIDALVPSPAEVAHILPLPVFALGDTSRRTIHHFRIDAMRPYYKVRAGDLIVPSFSGQSTEVMKEILRLEVWGLSGWFLNNLAWKLGWMDRPVPEVHEG